MPTIFESQPAHLEHYESHKSLLNQSQHRYFHSFCVNPHVRFESQSEGERVYLLLRSHPITQIPWITATVVLFIVPIVLNTFLGQLILFRYLLFGTMMWYSLLFSYIFLNILNYLFNVGLVTDRRIVDIDFVNILYKEVDETVLSKIEDVTTKTGGFIRSFFHFGDLLVQTAGAVSYIDFLGIPDPTDAATIINELMQRQRE